MVGSRAGGRGEVSPLILLLQQSIQSRGDPHLFAGVVLRGDPDI